MCFAPVPFPVFPLCLTCACHSLDILIRWSTKGIRHKRDGRYTPRVCEVDAGFRRGPKKGALRLRMLSSRIKLVLEAFRWGSQKFAYAARQFVIMINGDQLSLWFPSCSTSSIDWWITHCPMMQPKPESQVSCMADMTTWTCPEDRLNNIKHDALRQFQYMSFQHIPIFSSMFQHVSTCFTMFKSVAYFQKFPARFASMRCMPWRTISKESFQRRSACRCWKKPQLLAIEK